MIKKGAIPVSATRLQKVSQRQDDALSLLGAPEQFDANFVPPACEQRKSVLIRPLVNDPSHMDSFASSGAIPVTSERTVKPIVGPATRKSYYEVIVPTVE